LSKNKNNEINAAANTNSSKPNDNKSKNNHNKSNSAKNEVTVYSDYFINDKSLTMNDPTNPNVVNFYRKECKKKWKMSRNNRK